MEFEEIDSRQGIVQNGTLLDASCAKTIFLIKICRILQLTTSNEAKFCNIADFEEHDTRKYHG